MTHAIIGSNGQIGTCVSEFLSQKHETDVVKVDIGINYKAKDVDFMHVCIPYSDRFVSIVQQYDQEFHPRHIIIYSTVLPGTTELVGKHACHSPVEGRHPNLIEGFLTFDRFVGGESSDYVGAFFEDMGLCVQTWKDAKVTELGKILSTTRYGVNLAFAKAQKDLCEQFGVNFQDAVLQYQRMYNVGYMALGESRFIQPTLTPPEGKIGGHCVVPNAKLLTQISDDPFISKVATFND